MRIFFVGVSFLTHIWALLVKSFYPKSIIRFWAITIWWRIGITVWRCVWDNSGVLLGLSQRCVKNRQARGREKSVIERMLMDVIFVPLAYAYVRTLQGFCVFCCHKCHIFGTTPCYCVGYLCFIMFFDAFAENIGLFYWKRRLVLLKTTCWFVENDVLFYWKWRVVLLKMTCCFLERTEDLRNIRGKRKNRMGWKDKSCWGVWHLW